MDVISWIPAFTIIIVIASVMIYRYSMKALELHEQSTDNRVFDAVRIIVSMLDDMDLSSDHKKELAVDYVVEICKHIGYEIDIQRIGDMIEDAVFILHKTIDFLHKSKGD